MNSDSTQASKNYRRLGLELQRQLALNSDLKMTRTNSSLSAVLVIITLVQSNRKTTSDRLTGTMQRFTVIKV